MPVKPANSNASLASPFLSMDSRETRSAKAGARVDERAGPNLKKPDALKEWNFSSGIKIFHFGDGAPAPLTATGFVPMPPDQMLPGFLCQAAREMLSVSQTWLWERAQVSKKTINDFENGYSSPKTALNLRIKRALEQAGAQFVHGEDIVGVVVYTSRGNGRP